MTRDALLARLHAHGIADTAVSFDSEFPNEAWAVIRTATGYDVFYGERGMQRDGRSFASEDAALDYVWRQLAP